MCIFYSSLYIQLSTNLFICLFFSQKRLTGSIPKQRTISINLKKNKEHEFSDYVHTIRASPSIPFKADQAPKAPVLKPSPSPILVKGPLLRKRIHEMAAAAASPQLKHRKMRQTAADFFLSQQIIFQCYSIEILHRLSSPGPVDCWASYLPYWVVLIYQKQIVFGSIQCLFFSRHGTLLLCC